MELIPKSLNAFTSNNQNETEIQQYMQTKRKKGYKHEDAIKFDEKAKDIKKRKKAKKEHQEHCINQANSFWNKGNFEKAKNSYKEALDYAMERGDKDCEGTSYLGLASVANKEFKYEIAQTWYQKALDISETEPTDTILKEKALVGLGIAWFNLGEIQKAIAYTEKARQFAGREPEEGMVLALH